MDPDGNDEVDHEDHDDGNNEDCNPTYPCVQPLDVDQVIRNYNYFLFYIHNNNLDYSLNNVFHLNVSDDMGINVD